MDFHKITVRYTNRSMIFARFEIMISHHRMRFVFKRYNILNNTYLKLAAQKQAFYSESQTSQFQAQPFMSPQKKEANQSGYPLFHLAEYINNPMFAVVCCG